MKNGGRNGMKNGSRKYLEWDEKWDRNFIIQVIRQCMENGVDSECMENGGRKWMQKLVLKWR